MDLVSSDEDEDPHLDEDEPIVQQMPAAPAARLREWDDTPSWTSMPHRPMQDRRSAAPTSASFVPDSLPFHHSDRRDSSVATVALKSKSRMCSFRHSIEL